MTPVRWLVDGMNVIGSRPDGWWRDRDAAVRKLVERLDRYRNRTGDAVVAVFDGPRPRELVAGGVQVAFAPRRRRNSADDEIVRMLREEPDPAAIHVVTSDVDLAARARATGAAVTASGDFLRLLDRGAP